MKVRVPGKYRVRVGFMMVSVRVTGSVYVKVMVSGRFRVRFRVMMVSVRVTGRVYVKVRIPGFCKGKYESYRENYCKGYGFRKGWCES